MRNVPLTTAEARTMLLRAQEHRAAVEEAHPAGDPVATSAPEAATDVARWRAELAVRAAIVLLRVARADSDNFVIEACADLSAAAVQLRLATRERA